MTDMVRHAVLASLTLKRADPKNGKVEKAMMRIKERKKNERKQAEPEVAFVLRIQCRPGS